jgi:hypothetical protein
LEPWTSMTKIAGSGSKSGSGSMRSSLVVTASDCQCTSCNGPGFYPSIRRHCGFWGAPDKQAKKYYSEAWIRGSGSTQKCHGSGTLPITQVFLNSSEVPVCYADQKPNSWTCNFVEVSGKNLESSQTWDFRIQCLHYKAVSNPFCSRGRKMWIAREKP